MSYLNMHDKQRIVLTNISEENKARQLLVDEKMAAEKELVESGLSDEQFDKKNATEQQRQRRSFIINKITRLNKEISAINKRIAPLKEKAYLQVRFIEDILREALPLDVAEELLRERDRRVRGLSPQLVVAKIPSKECASCNKLKSANKVLVKGILEYQRLLDKARETIINWVESGMPTINKGDYMKAVSPINTCVPTRQELYQMKNRYKNLLNSTPNDAVSDTTDSDSSTTDDKQKTQIKFKG